MTNRKFLLFDADHSLESIGSREQQAELLGVPPVRIGYGVDQVLTYIKGRDATSSKPKIPALIAQHEETEDHPIFGPLPGEKKWAFTPTAQELGLTGIMIDTLSELAEQTKDRLIEEHKKQEMNRHLWTLYIDKMRRFYHFMSQLDVPVIMTSHIRRDEDEHGAPMDAPGVPAASTRQNTARYFTAVFYSRVDSNHKTGQTTYSWQTKPSTRYFFAKQRSGYNDDDPLPAYIPQNFNLVLDAYAEQGHDAPKILILGDSGQGKTTSLATINAPYDAEMAQAT